MNLNQYQNEAMRTAIFPIDQGIEYTTLGLVSEAGEVAGKVKKIIRDHDGNFSTEQKAAIADEVGDCLWYVAALARELGYPLDHVAHMNLNKLESRARRGQLKGNGDNR
ncbi:nucleoside triphosphate pyrophosphohydrolase family protein [Glutamicibacter sp. FR1]|uniref:nucleoside triphosphate pyrophosphohydrolase family protein n=1 Tax=Glutamicibacter sp. FR1 TaxID=3393744 RepID=UPI0039AFC72E